MKYLPLLLLSSLLASAQLWAEKPANIRFEKTVLDEQFRSEGVAVGDFNHDGKLDIGASDVYFAAPDWKMHPMVAKPKTHNPKGYSQSFCNFADDLNGDGRTDFIVVGFPGKETTWLEQPAKPGELWKSHRCTPVTNNESPNYLDVNQDGQRELLMGVKGGAMAYLTPTKDPTADWKIHPISTPQSVAAKKVPNIQRFYHGLGAGDVNDDGRTDVLVPDGWWENTGTEGEWTFHKAPFGPKCANMYVYDFDGDGDNDVLMSSAHAFGIWWHEQTPDGWQQHEIDKTFSQTHSMCLADINGDGLPDFVTGKRWWAHGGRDPGGDQPPVLHWFELRRENGTAQWIRHQIDHNSGIGTQFEVADVNADGLLDIAVSNKRGTFYFRQVRE